MLYHQVILKIARLLIDYTVIWTARKGTYMIDATATSNPNQETKFKVDKNAYGNIVRNINYKLKGANKCIGLF